MILDEGPWRLFHILDRLVFYEVPAFQTRNFYAVFFFLPRIFLNQLVKASFHSWQIQKIISIGRSFNIG